MEKQEKESRDSSGLNAIKTVASGGTLKFGGRMITLTLGLAVQIMMARLLTPDSYGSVTLAIAVLSIALRFGTLGMDSGISHLYPKYEDEPPKARGVARAIFRLSVFSGIAIAVLLSLLSEFLANSVFNEPKLVPLIRIIAIGLPFVIIGENAIALGRAARDARPRVFVYDILRPLLRFGFIGALIFFGLDALGAVIGHMVAMVVAGLVAVLIVLRLLPTWDAIPEPMNRSLLSYSFPLLFASGVNYLMSNIDTFMVGYYLISDKVGIYNIAYQLGTFAIFFLGAGSYILPPMLARLESKGQTYEMDQLYRTITKWIAFASIPIILLLTMYSGEIIVFLFGSRYLEGANVLRILVLGTFVNIALGAAGGALTSLGNNRIVLYTVTGAAVLNTAANVILIPRFGILGAGIATTTSTAALALLNATVLYRFHGLIPLGWLGLRTITISGVAAMLLLAVSISTSFSTLLAGILWIVVYLATIVLGGLNQRDKEIIISIENRLGVRVPLLDRLI